MSVNIIKIQNGSPINNPSSQMDSVLAKPPLVTFWNRMTFAHVLDGDGIALWFSRTIPANNPSVIGDGISLNISATSLSMVLSGGSQNNNSLKSTGGDYSSQAVDPTTLFNDIPPASVATGYTDYRCVYLFNDGATISNLTLSVSPLSTKGATTLIGVDQRTDTQNIVISGQPTSGCFTLRYFDTSTITVSSSSSSSGAGYFSDGYYYFNPICVSGNLTSNLRAAINACPLFGFSDATVTSIVANGNTIITISFGGTGNYRYFELLELVSSTLL